ncbi:hypothetical protein PR202_gb02914 [Eleusine coracana subsp. coracana]|uniref:Uncharacterized protein n=1 Tax=Eleusine coracana subsp. coracana TaxID=191504 RepID=A0AAV5DZX5_ELECO|nr:hypothetical protein QOZ80_8BG0663220 [Eleusine coracana subsp. coracana]GJN15965.1 hypothetical protein PR202_gb02914 [Eleusine coracana subsp. coracana]
MYNPPEQQQQMVAPRMSFSSDFALEPPPPSSSGPARAAGDADFEFTPVGSRPMMAADQLFSKGRILPLREARGPVTLRDELRAPDAAAAANAGRRVPRWKELLGLKRSHKNKGSAAAADAHVDLGEHGDTGQ